MIKRLKIGLIYSYNEQWIAGSYYILNLIHAVNHLQDEYKPELIIFSISEDGFQTVKDTGYPYLRFHYLDQHEFLPSYSFIEKAINKFSDFFFKKNIITKDTTKRLRVEVDAIFPASYHVYFSEMKNKLFWIPDFQEHFLPQFFSTDEIESRKKYQLRLSKDRSSIVFSSHDALHHFKTLYPDSGSKTYVLQFAVTHPDYQSVDHDDLLSKFAIDKPYFFCPNQVWIHKNHLTVLKAVKRLKEQQVTDCLVVFSGKQYDNRNPEVFQKLQNYITEHNLEENVKFLGFIDRKEQLQLMNLAVSIIQPSLFEGWSTSIEDAKAMDQFVIVSDLPVHREQIKMNAAFFDPKDEKQLAMHMQKLMQHPPVKERMDSYKRRVIDFGEQFIDIIKSVITLK